jgi:hypothetical protein
MERSIHEPRRCFTFEKLNISVALLWCTTTPVLAIPLYRFCVKPTFYLGIPNTLTKELHNDKNLRQSIDFYLFGSGGNDFYS